MSQVFRTPIPLRIGMLVCSLLLLLMLTGVVFFIVTWPPATVGLWLMWGGLLWATLAPGFTNVMWYRGGLEAWKAGLPTMQPGPPR